MVEDTFISHLMELRDRLLRSLIAIGIVFVVLFPFANDLYDLLAYPLMRTLPEGSRMIATGVVTPFLIPVKVAMMAAFLMVLPYVLYQAWAFVAPGLYSHEKRLVLPLVVASTILFIAGLAFCYFFVFGVVFDFVYKIAPKSITVAPDIENYLSFALTMFLAFGVAFEVPCGHPARVMGGIRQQLREARPTSSSVVRCRAIVTPPDVISQLLLATPLCLLYEAGIIAARFVVKRKPPGDDYRPLTDAEQERELDRIEAQEKRDNV
jgi:sec-independent protein translocase protein TatC